MTAHTARSKISNCTADRPKLLMCDLPPAARTRAGGTATARQGAPINFHPQNLVVAVALWATKSASHREAATAETAASELLFW